VVSDPLRSDGERDEPDIRDEDRAFRNKVAVVDVVFSCRMSHAFRANWVPAKGLLDACLQVRKLCTVRESRKTVVSNNLVDLRLCAALNIRVEQHA
jgi:hypothetical protein